MIRWLTKKKLGGGCGVLAQAAAGVGMFAISGSAGLLAAPPGDPGSVKRLHLSREDGHLSREDGLGSQGRRRKGQPVAFSHAEGKGVGHEHG
jgi:hypothetical protein